jgi:3-phenylpropionate/trans-cinnamate dioxygenase ferredoxin subunit
MSRWIDALGADELAAGGRRLLWREGREVVLFRVADRHYALDDRCPHAGASLCSGKLEGSSLTCRAHGRRFDLASGCLLGAADGPAVQTFAVRIRNGRVEIDLEPGAA